MDKYLDTIATDYGLLGLLFAGSLVLVGILFRLLLLEKDKRIEDARKVNQEIATPIAHIKDSLALLDQKVRISKKAENEDF